MMKRVLTVVSVLALIASAAALAAAKPSIRLVKTSPTLVTHGAAFKAGEKVTLTLTLSADTDRTRTVRASRSGTFTADLGRVPIAGRCGGYRIAAHGSRGSNAVLKIMHAACMPASAS
jgi:hypothetical protein